MSSINVSNKVKQQQQQQQNLDDYKKFLAWIHNRIEDKTVSQMSLRQKQKLISKCLQIFNELDKNENYEIRGELISIASIIDMGNIGNYFQMNTNCELNLNFKPITMDKGSSLINVYNTYWSIMSLFQDMEMGKNDIKILLNTINKLLYYFEINKTNENEKNLDWLEMHKFNTDTSLETFKLQIRNPRFRYNAYMKILIYLNRMLYPKKDKETMEYITLSKKLIDKTKLVYEKVIKLMEMSNEAKFNTNGFLNCMFREKDWIKWNNDNCNDWTILKEKSSSKDYIKKSIQNFHNSKIDYLKELTKQERQETKEFQKNIEEEEDDGNKLGKWDDACDFMKDGNEFKKQSDLEYIEEILEEEKFNESEFYFGSLHPTQVWRFKRKIYSEHLNLLDEDSDMVFHTKKFAKLIHTKLKRQ